MEWPNLDYSIYHRYFLNCSAGQVTGEATPVYSYWPTSIARIRRYNPDVRLILGLREPVSRAYSHWEMEVSRGQERLGFSSAIREGRARVAEDEQSFHGCVTEFSATWNVVSTRHRFAASWNIFHRITFLTSQLIS